MMRAGGTGGVWLLSCLPVALPTLYPPAEISLGTASILALAAMPWLAWAGLPGRRDASSIGASALCLPPLAAALALDLGRGSALPSALAFVLAAIAMVFVLGWSARRASTVRAPVRIYDVAWLVLVPGLPVLRWSLDLAGGPASSGAPGWLDLATGASPIAWAFCPGASPWPALAACAVLALLALPGGLGRPEPRG